MICRKTGELVSINHHGLDKRRRYARMHNVMSIDDQLALRYTAGSDDVLVHTYTVSACGKPFHLHKRRGGTWEWAHIGALF